MGVASGCRNDKKAPLRIIGGDAGQGDLELGRS